MTQQPKQAQSVDYHEQGCELKAVRVGFRSPWAARIDLASEDRQACNLPLCCTVRKHIGHT